MPIETTLSTRPIGWGARNPLGLKPKVRTRRAALLRAFAAAGQDGCTATDAIRVIGCSRLWAYDAVQRFERRSHALIQFAGRNRAQRNAVRYAITDLGRAYLDGEDSP